MNYSRLFVSVFSVFICGLLCAGEITPEKHDGQVVLFEAGKTDIKQVRNRTASWEEGDLCPVLELVKHNKEDRVKFYYSGERGLAQSSLRFAEGLEELKKEGQEFYGIALEIDYLKGDFAKLDVGVYSGNGVMFTKRITLAPDVNEYIVDRGHTRYPEGKEGIAFDWNKISLVTLLYRTITNNNAKQSFLLKKIYVLQRKSDKKFRNITVAETRTVLEIFPATGKIVIDGTLGDKAWSSAGKITDFYYYRSDEKTSDSPFTAQITYDSENLYIGTRSLFPTPPNAIEVKRDGVVWQDEAIEYFFCAENDNRSTIQFAINAIDTVFDYKVTYNPEKNAWKKDMSASIAHERKASYKNNIFLSEIAFPLNAIGVDSKKTKFIGFQLAQDYTGREDNRLRLLSWAMTRAFPDAKRFGILVFNNKVFGPGEITIARIRKTKGSNKTSEFTVDFTLEGFIAGKYKLEKILVNGSGEKTVSDENISIDKDTVKRSSVFPGIIDSNGIYSVYITLTNQNNDSRVFSANFVNSVDPVDLFGKRVFCPAPKKIEWGRGQFMADSCVDLWLSNRATARTKKTASILSQKYYDFTGVRLEKSTGRNRSILRQKGLILRISKRAYFNGKNVKLKKEGYCLQVKPDRVIITGADEPGLFYGGITFFQLLKNSMQIKEGNPVPVVEVLDWPDLHNRVVNLEHARQLWAKPFKEVRGIEYLMDWADRFVADNKFNIFFLDVSGTTRYKRRPEFNGPDKIYTLEDLGKLADFCRDRFISLSPRWACGGHANWWLLRSHPELREKGFTGQADVTHPEHDKIVYDCMLDVIEAVKPQYVSPKGDEWWHKRKAGETPDELLRGKTRAQAFRDFHAKMRDWLAKQGVKMTLYEDTLSPYHNGKKHDTYKIVDDLPKDIIITWWKGGHYLNEGLPWMIDKGFEIWGICTGFYTFNDDQKKQSAIKGFGKTLYGFNNWLYSDHSNFYNYLPYVLLRTADYAWNMQSDKRETIEDYTETGKAYAGRSLFSIKPNPYAGENFSPIDISQSVTNSFNSILKSCKIDAVSLPSGKEEIGLIPMLFTGEKKNCILLQDEKEVSIPVNRKFSSLVFLHTAFVDMDLVRKEKIKLPSKRNWPYGYPVGKYLVNYKDGTNAVLKLRSGENIIPATLGPLFRDTLDHRYTYLVHDEDGKTLGLYQWEWINPDPDKEIKEISVTGEGVFDPRVLKTVLFAVTGREVKSSRK